MFPFYWDSGEPEGLSWDSLSGQQVHFIGGKGLIQHTIWGTCLVQILRIISVCLMSMFNILCLMKTVELIYNRIMATVVRLIVDQVDDLTATWCSDPQQTGFKGNLRLLIKPFEQPHLPFKILSAALHCSARTFCVLLPSLTSQFALGFSSLCPQSKGPNDLLHLAFSLCPWEMNHKERVAVCATFISALLLYYLCFLML